MADELKSLIEAALYVSGKPVTIEDLAKICNSGNIGSVRMVAEELAADYLARDLGLIIEHSDKGFEMKVKNEYENKVMHLVPEADMPGAVLRVLALIASHQPIKQSDVIKLRGNGAYKYIKRLKEEELIESKKSSRTALLTTTPKFKEYFHILDMKELVKNVDNLPVAIVPSDEETEKPEDDKQAVLTDVVDAETGMEKEIEEERNKED